ncbi:hypothetical protein B0H12DRAFT_990774, partial [Mycena haematopus]
MASGLLRAYFPQTFERYTKIKNALLAADRRAIFPSDSTVYSATAFELGGPHRQGLFGGLVSLRRHEIGGWDNLIALGEYEPSLGGQVIFWDLGLVVGFPPGSSILLPSGGVLRYSFVAVRPHERRYSILQWAGAGVSRWLDNG